MGVPTVCPWGLGFRVEDALKAYVCVLSVQEAVTAARDSNGQVQVYLRYALGVWV